MKNTLKVGDKLHFKKFYWLITKKIEHISGHTSYKYRVYHKYFRAFNKYLVPLTNTKCEYEISQWRWDFLKKMLEKDKNYHYSMSLWSNNPR